MRFERYETCDCCDGDMSPNRFEPDAEKYILNGKALCGGCYEEALLEIAEEEELAA